MSVHADLCNYSLYAGAVAAAIYGEIQALASQWWNPWAWYAIYTKLGILQFWVTEQANYMGYCAP